MTDSKTEKLRNVAVKESDSDSSSEDELQVNATGWDF